MTDGSPSLSTASSDGLSPSATAPAPDATSVADPTAAPEAAALDTLPEPIPVPTEVIAGSAPASGSSAVKPPYPSAPADPTQKGREGLRFDFNDGCRVALPETGHPWRVRLSDLDTGNVLFETELKSGRKIDETGEVRAGPVEAGDKTQCDRVTAPAKDDGYRRGRCLSRQRCGEATGNEHGYAAADEIGCERRQPI